MIDYRLPAILIPACFLVMLRHKSGFEIAKIKKIFVLILLVELVYKTYMYVDPADIDGIYIGGLVSSLVAFTLWNRWLYEELFLSNKADSIVSYKAYEMAGLYLLLCFIIVMFNVRYG